MHAGFCGREEARTKHCGTPAQLAEDGRRLGDITRSSAEDITSSSTLKVDRRLVTIFLDC